MRLKEGLLRGNFRFKYKWDYFIIILKWKRNIVRVHVIKSEEEVLNVLV